MLKGFKQEESLIPLLEYSSKTFIMILRLSQCATRGMTPSAFPSELPSYQPSTNPTSIPSKASTIESSISVSVSPSKIPSENPTSSTYPTISPPCCIEDYFGTYDTYVGWNRKYEIILGPESSSLYEFSDKVGRRYNDFYFRFQREVGSIATPVHLGYNYFQHGCIDVFLIQSPVVIKPQLSVSKVSYYNYNIIGCVPDSSNKVTLLLPLATSLPSSYPTVSSSPSLTPTSTFPPSPNRTVSFCVAHEHGFLFSSLRFFSNCKIVILAVYMYSI